MKNQNNLPTNKAKKKKNDIKPASEIVLAVLEANQAEYVTLGEITNSLNKHGFLVFFIIFAFPIAIPLPYPPGFPSIIALPLLAFSVQMFLGYDHPVLPSYLNQKKISQKLLSKMVKKMSYWLKKIESFSKPRMVEVMENEVTYKVLSLVIMASSVCIILPILFGNALPSLGIVLIALGLLNEDGAFALAGVIASIIGMLVAFFVVYLGIGAIKLLLGDVAILHQIPEILQHSEFDNSATSYT